MIKFTWDDICCFPQYPVQHIKPCHCCHVCQSSSTAPNVTFLSIMSFSGVPSISPISLAPQVLPGTASYCHLKTQQQKHIFFLGLVVSLWRFLKFVKIKRDVDPTSWVEHGTWDAPATNFTGQLSTWNGGSWTNKQQPCWALAGLWLVGDLWASHGAFTPDQFLITKQSQRQPWFSLLIHPPGRMGSTPTTNHFSFIDHLCVIIVKEGRPGKSMHVLYLQYHSF